MATVTMPPWATLANQQTMQSDITQIKTDVAALKTQALPLGPVRYHIQKVVSGGVELKWKDPVDTVIAGYPAAYWQKTTIVRKEGGDPTSITDGTVVVVNTTRDQYKATPFLDTDGTATSHYRAFPQATSGYVNESTDNIFRTYSLFGFTIDQANPDPDTCITYTDDCTDFDAIRMDFANDAITGTSDWMATFLMPKPCMLHRADTDHSDASYVDYYLDPDDYTKKADGVTASDVTNTSYDGNAMMEFPPVFLKVERDGARIHFSISDVKLDDGFEAWSAKAHDGTYHPWYQPIYDGYVVSSVMRSISSNQKPTANTTAANEWAYATANNKLNDQGYGTTLWADEQIMMIMGWMVIKSLNVQTAIGGVYNTASALQMNCGAGNTKGMFYGKNDGSYTPTKLFGMENRWAHRWRRAQGINVLDYQIIVKMTLSEIDGSSGVIVASDQSADYAGYIKTADAVPAVNGTYINAVNTGNLSAGVVKSAVGGSSSSYFCDGSWTTTGLRGVVFGGAVNTGLFAGFAALSANNAPSYAIWHYGASLSYHHF